MNLKSIAGKIVNYNNSFFGEISFDNKIISKPVISSKGFFNDENIKNKEANLLIAIRYRVYPESVEEFVRYLVYRATQSSSLVKNKELFDSIKESNTDISLDLESYDMKKVAQVFNRFKPIFLSFKQAHKNNKKYIYKK